MIYELSQDLHDAVTVIPPEHPKHRMLELLEEAIRRDIHFIDRHPTTLFQCMWNSCWWYDCPEAARYYEEPEGGWKQPPPWLRAGAKLHESLDAWRTGKETPTPGFRWLRSLRPPATHLGGRLIAVLHGHADPVRTVAFSPDSARIASGGEDMTVRLWDTKTGQAAACLRGHSKAVACCSFSPSGDRVVSGSWDGTLMIWNTMGSEEPRRLTGHQGRVRACAFSPDGTIIASVAADETIRFWNSRTGQELGVVGGMSRDTTVCKFSPEGKYIGSIAGDGTVRLWRRDALGSACVTLENGSVGCLAFSPDGQYLLSGLTIWRVDDGRELKRFAGHNMQIKDCAWSPDGLKALTASRDRTLILWDAGCACSRRGIGTRPVPATPSRTKALVRRVECLDEIGWCLDEFTAVRATRGAVLVSLGTDDRRAAAFPWQLEDRLLCSFSPDATRCMSPGRPGFFDPWTGEEISHLPALEVGGKPATRKQELVAFSPDGTRFARHVSNETLEKPTSEAKKDEIVIMSEDGTVLERRKLDYPLSSPMLYVLTTPEKAGTYDTKGNWRDAILLWGTEWVNCFGIIRKGQPRVTVCLLGEDKKIDMPKEHGFIQGLSFSPDGSLIMTAKQGIPDGDITLWDVQRGAEACALSGDEFHLVSCAFSPDGEHLIAARRNRAFAGFDADQHLLVTYAVRNGKSEDRLLCKGAAPCRSQYSPDGTCILTSFDDGTLKLWTPRAEEELKEVRAHAEGFVNFVFSPDAQFILTAGYSVTRESELKLWHLRTLNLVARITVPFSPDALAMRPTGLVIASDLEDRVAFFRLHAPLGPSVVIPVRLFLPELGSFDLQVTVRCAWCGDRSAVPPKLASAANAHMRSSERSDEKHPSQPPHPDQGIWQDTRLLINCPWCNSRLRLTPFCAHIERRSR